MIYVLSDINNTKIHESTELATYKQLTLPLKTCVNYVAVDVLRKIPSSSIENFFHPPENQFELPFHWETSAALGKESTLTKTGHNLRHSSFEEFCMSINFLHSHFFVEIKYASTTQ